MRARRVQTLPKWTVLRHRGKLWDDRSTLRIAAPCGSTLPRTECPTSIQARKTQSKRKVLGRKRNKCVLWSVRLQQWIPKLVATKCISRLFIVVTQGIRQVLGCKRFISIHGPMRPQQSLPKLAADSHGFGVFQLQAQSIRKVLGRKRYENVLWRLRCWEPVSKLVVNYDSMSNTYSHDRSK